MANIFFFLIIFILINRVLKKKGIYSVVVNTRPRYYTVPNTQNYDVIANILNKKQNRRLQYLKHPIKILK